MNIDIHGHEMGREELHALTGVKWLLEILKKLGALPSQPPHPSRREPDYDI
jgi:hypothetical protein